VKKIQLSFKSDNNSGTVSEAVRTVMTISVVQLSQYL